MVFLIFGETIIPCCYAVHFSLKDQQPLVRHVLEALKR
ncbi:hypothetical protein BFV96_4979 [Alteromonas macleodii]|uniref:Uncharacterized protein n=1 Tax=Alteromonas macleodii TaxID=28108 RepID=A0AB36FLN8_ALTMA|nr:hypothetical protein BFV93_4910 [Alteromonas macleodii]OES25742.1 hypothetical protein BFV95_4318 [Alteromonas macleodii]OES38463.1 hypothetical protein BFV96_4979 [Alteromonas macleodii]